MENNKVIKQVFQWLMLAQLFLGRVAFAKSIKEALHDTAQEGLNLADAFLVVVIIGIGFGIAWPKTRAATIKHLPFLAMAAYLIYNAASVVGWFKSFLS